MILKKNFKFHSSQEIQKKVQEMFILPKKFTLIEVMLGNIIYHYFRVEDHPDFWGVAPGKVIGLK